MGLAAVFGLGGPRDSRYQYLAVDLAGQFRYYLIGTFDHGFDLGAQVKTLILTDGYITWGGLSITPMVGYKLATTVGFTFDAQLGPEFILGGPTASLVQVNTAPAVPIGLLLNLNVGWSF